MPRAYAAPPPRAERRAAGVTLVSGLPLAGQSSFTRQLSLLALHLEREGWSARLVGPQPGRPGRFPGLEPGGTEPLILLGYPDQFPFLPAAAGRRGREGLGLYLWAQFSRPPDPRPLSGVGCVPLTPATAAFLSRAGGGLRVLPVIPHGVDTGRLRPPTPEERAAASREWDLGDGFVVGTVAAHTPRKRLDLVLEAFALFRREERGMLVIRTDRQVSHEGTDLLARARRAGIEGSLRLLLEPLSDGQLARLYGRMDAYLNLSEWEGFCLPVAEAMACGVPVVRPPIQGPGELVPYPELAVKARAVRREGGAELVEADPPAAAAALLEAARSPGLRARLAAAGRREAVRRYGMRRVARLWTRRLADGLPESRPPGG